MAPWNGPKKGPDGTINSANPAIMGLGPVDTEPSASLSVQWWLGQRNLQQLEGLSSTPSDFYTRPNFHLRKYPHVSLI